MANRINIKDIIVKKEYHDLVPRMNKEDDELLDASIKDEGIREPITLNQDHVLLDGHSRLAKAKKHNYTTVPYRIKQFQDKLIEKKYVIECNLQRRHLTNFQRVEQGMILLQIEKQLAQKRKKESGKIHGRGKENRSGSNDPNLFEKGKALEVVAKKVGVSYPTMMRGKKIIESAPKHLVQKARENKTSINSIYNEITRKDRNLPKVDLPSGKYSVVMMDLPIQFNDVGVRGSSSNNYDTIPIPEIKLGMFNGKDVRELFLEDCVIFAWFQASTIFYAKEILSAWGFKCITNQIWNKGRIGTGTWLANLHEHLVIATKGKMPVPAERVPSVVTVPPENRTHSSKPKFFYEQTEKLYPNRKYLDLFSRYKHNENWTCFGNQLETLQDKLKSDHIYTKEDEEKR